MIIESEQEEPVFDTEPYYRQGPLAEVDHPATGNLDCLPQYASGDLRPTGASTTATRSRGAPMEAQGRRRARRVMKYEFLFVELYNCIAVFVVALFCLTI